jgi:hypothetical protein
VDLSQDRRLDIRDADGRAKPAASGSPLRIVRFGSSQIEPIAPVGTTRGEGVRDVRQTGERLAAQ